VRRPAGRVANFGFLFCFLRKQGLLPVIVLMRAGQGQMQPCKAMEGRLLPSGAQRLFSRRRPKQATVPREYANGTRERWGRLGECAGALGNKPDIP